MTQHYRARYRDGSLRLLTNRPPDLRDGEIVLASVERGRSMASHRHQFAWLADAWQSLPESAHGKPWAETPETLRKHALIATGFHNHTVIDCGTNAAAERVMAALVAAEMRAHGYAVGRVAGPVAQVWTPESQSLAAMGGDRFKESKRAVLEWVAEKVGVAPDDLEKAGQ